MSSLQLTSPDFSDQAFIPRQFTCEGENISPPLSIEGVPEDAQSLALIVTDPDIPDEVKDKMSIEVFDHWVAYNIPADTTGINDGEKVGSQGQNSSGNTGYTGPCPPTQYEPTEHRYVFQLYALDTMLDLSAGAGKQAVREEMKGHTLATDKLIGRYDKTSA